MRKTLFILLLPFIVIAKAQNIKMSFFEQTSKFQIEGKINGYQPGGNNGFITFRTYSIMGRSKDTAISINKYGNFICELYQPFEGDIALMYNDEYIDMYASPSEKIFIEIDESNWKTVASRTKAVTFLGKSANLSKQIIDFQHEINDHQFKNNPDMDDKNQGDEKFATVSVARMKEELDFLNDYLIKTQVKDKKFIQWCRNKIVYKTGYDICMYCFGGKINETITYKQLTDYLVSIPVNNSGAVINSAYYEFLRMLVGDFQIISNINPIYKDTIKQKGNSKLLVNLEKIDAYSTGIARELMYYFIYTARNTKRNNEYEFNISRFDSVITEPYLRQLFIGSKSNEAQIFTPFNIIERIKNHIAGDSLSNRLATLLEKHKNAYVFMDFWGSWCAPCMGEMPLYPKLIDKFKDKPIVFLFLAVDTKEEKIQEVKTRYKINGEFISLNDNETKIFNNVLQFSSYPSHFMLDPTGTLVNNKISHLSSGGELNNLIFEQINNTMSKK